MLSKETSKEFHETFAQLFVHNVRLNGLRATLYCFGLSASRYIEYTSALIFLNSELKASSIILETGCGHSILPTLLAKSDLEVVTLDISRDALKWQISKSRETLCKSSHAVLADGRNLPFKDASISAISCISAIEHVPGNGDIQAAREIGRTLEPNGLCIISFPLSTRLLSYSKREWTAEIPPLIGRFSKFFLPMIFEKFKVDRTLSYFERFYSLKDVHKRIITASCCIKEDYLALNSGWFVKFIYERLIPTGVFTPLEFVMARFLTVSRCIQDIESVILKMRKPSYA
jgi:ubiquinone/menaquinone biosynthesis C-methylase UbiE